MTSSFSSKYFLCIFCVFVSNIFSMCQGLLAAHRGGYIDSQKEEGPAPLLWRFSDFLKWAELCPSEQEIGHSLMRLVITGQEIPHACEVCDFVKSLLTISSDCLMNF